jgi:hypothetical protein
VIEDIFRMYMMDKQSKWEDYFHLVEFTYYQDSLNMSPFEALYGRKCNTLVSWDNPIEKVVLGIEFLKAIEEKMVRIKHNLKEKQDR